MYLLILQKLIIPPSYPPALMGFVRLQMAGGHGNCAAGIALGSILLLSGLRAQVLSVSF